MRIWVLTNEYGGNIVGGLGVVSTYLSRALAKIEEVHVTVICKSYASKVTVENSESLRVIRFPRKSMYHSVISQNFNALPIAGWLKTNGFIKPDLIHVHSLQCDKLAQYYKRKFHVPIIYTCHSLAILEKYQPGRVSTAARQNRLIRIADAITVPSQWQENKIRQFYPFYKRQIKVIQNGVIPNNKYKSRQANPYHLLYVGRLNAMKGIEELLHAVSLLKYRYPQIKLDIVGKGSKLYMLKLKKRTLTLDISRNIKWWGKLQPRTVQKLYSSYGAVVVPSHHESFGLVALEAMANGIPLVSTRNGGLSSFVNGSNAAIISTVSASIIARSIRVMWETPELTIQRIEEAKNTARAYGWTQISQQYHSFFTQKIVRGTSIARE
jgi:glycogen(starch) synthase